MSATWRVVLLVSVAGLVAVPAASAGRSWDTGAAISGYLEGKDITIAASVTGPSTDTMSRCDTHDGDHWIDEEQSTPDDQGTDADAWATWSATKCWWWCEGGAVSQGNWTTTWTAPAEAGEWRLECAAEDLPKEIPPSESGCRDDSRHYAGTDYAGEGQQAMGMSSLALAEAGAGNPPPPAASLRAVLTKWFNCPVQGPLDHPQETGDGRRNEVTTPDNSWGFFKKVEFQAEIFPHARAAGRYFTWVQKVIGEVTNEQGYQLGPYTTWEEDPSLCTHIPNPDYGHSIFFIDGPGVVRTVGPTGWDAPPGDLWVRICAPDDGGNPLRFIIKVKYGEDDISELPYWDVDGYGWLRHMRIYSNDSTGNRWVITNNE